MNSSPKQVHKRNDGNAAAWFGDLNVEIDERQVTKKRADAANHRAALKDNNDADDLRHADVAEKGRRKGYDHHQNGTDHSDRSGSGTRYACQVLHEITCTQDNKEPQRNEGLHTIGTPAAKRASVARSANSGHDGAIRLNEGYTRTPNV